jgi:hypothetical protein
MKYYDLERINRKVSRIIFDLVENGSMMMYQGIADNFRTTGD